MKSLKRYLRKAQAALEFIMTYGWAMLIVLIAIGFLAFFGVFSPHTFLPDMCVLGIPGLKCINPMFQIGEGTIGVI